MHQKIFTSQKKSRSDFSKIKCRNTFDLNIFQICWNMLLLCSLIKQMLGSWTAFPIQRKYTCAQRFSLLKNFMDACVCVCVLLLLKCIYHQTIEFYLLAWEWKNNNIDRHRRSIKLDEWTKWYITHVFVCWHYKIVIQTSIRQGNLITRCLSALWVETLIYALIL